nr:MAG TPA: putative peptidoglycan binding domain protein [Bacteriophage sp.]
MKTGSGMVEYARNRIGTPYFYGAKISEGALTEKKMSTMHMMYPKVVTNSYMSKARRKGQVGRVNVDCSGLIAGYRKLNLGSYQLYQKAYTRMPIAEVDDFAPGVVLWKSGHVGVYIGKVNGVPMCIEAKGINYGTVMTKVSATKWVYGLTFADISYVYDNKVDGTWKGTNPYSEPTAIVTSAAQARKKGIKVYISRGEGVKWIQWELMEAGLLTEKDIDGICGSKTVAAIIKYQQSCKITADGLAGKTTRSYLKAA